MGTFLMFGKYSPESLKDISGERTDKAVKLIKQYEGEVTGMYALIGEHDLLLIVNFPSVEGAMKASVALYKLTGVSFTTSPAVPVEVFDKIISEV